MASVYLKQEDFRLVSSFILEPGFLYVKWVNGKSSYLSWPSNEEPIITASFPSKKPPI